MAVARDEHPDDEMIVLFLSGALDARDEARVRAHVNTCDECRALLAEAARDDDPVPATRHKPIAAKEPSGTKSPLAGKYVLEEELGAGGMGRVFRGRHVGLDRKVAIKLLHPELTSDPTIIKRFEREARAAASLKSKHAVHILDIDYLPSGAPFIVMEYLEGSDLAHLLEKQADAMPLADAVNYVLEACEAIAEAHTRGIVHRDLKPQKLFLTRIEGGPPIVKILDFGLAKRLTSDAPESGANDSMTGAGGLIGTPHFMSPEQLRARDVDHRSDIWSIGATLYLLITGRPPFLATSFHVLAARMLKEDAQPMGRVRSDVPAVLDEIVLRCLRKDPAERFQSIDQFASALRAIVPQLQVFAAPATQRTVPGFDPHAMQTVDLTREAAPDTDRTIVDAPPATFVPGSSEESPPTIPLPPGAVPGPSTPRRR